jgi:hypothetical protein
MVDWSSFLVIDSRFSKDGDPITVYVPDRGFTGPFLWVDEHLRERAGRGYVLGAF